MRDLPVSAAVVVWTPTGPKIMQTDAQGDMVGVKRVKAALRAGVKPLPQSLICLSSYPPARPGARANPL